jgi:hypothetical protein
VVIENLLALPSHPGAKIALKSPPVPHSPEKKTIVARPPRLLEWMGRSTMTASAVSRF